MPANSYVIWLATSRFVLRAATAFLFLCQATYSQSAQTDLTKLDIEDLMTLEVTSVSKKTQSISDVAAAIFVITREDIRESTAADIPDLLRSVPGLQVAQIDGSSWAISARGLNDHFTDKLMVLLDGRSIYNTTFSGVYWDGLDTPLEDIERIEVIRGPGGSAWGANAVNGVINIITRNASETHGRLLVGGGGNAYQGFATLQSGGALKSGLDYRIFAKYFNDTNMTGLAGGSGRDQWNVARVGFRADKKFANRDALTVQGDLYTGEQGQIIPRFDSITSPVLVPTPVAVGLSGGYLQAGWDRHYSTAGDTGLRISVDRYHRGGLFNETRTTFGIDFQHHIGIGKRHDIVWGLGYNNTAASIRGSFTASTSAPNLATELLSGFFQDEIALIPDRLSLTLGSKLEHNHYTGFGVMPTGRLAWNVNDRHMLWAAVSRAIRTPATFDTAIYANFGGFVEPDGTSVLFRLLGNPSVKNEQLLAYEAGYRATMWPGLSIDVATYYNSFDDMTTTEPAEPFMESTPAPDHIVAPIVVGNLMHGETHGVEIFAAWKPAGRWTLIPAFAYEQVHMHPYPSSQDPFSAAIKEGSTPRYWGRLESRVDLTHSLGWNSSAAFVDRLPARGVAAYTRVDSKLAWNATDHLLLELVGQNLLQHTHLEFVDTYQALYSTEVNRSVFARISWQF